MDRSIRVKPKRQAFEGKYCYIFVFLFLFGGFLLPVVHAATYYIDSQNGNDSRTTTQAQNTSTPWLTIQKCADNAVAGDTCSVASGTYNERPNATTNGSSGNYITYKSVPARSATILGFDINGQYVRVEGFKVTNPSDTCDNVNVNCINGINIHASYAQVVNNYIYNWRGAPAIGPSRLVWATRYSSVSITNNLIYHSQYGIGVWGDNWTVDSNEVNRLYAYTFESYWDADYMRAWGIGLTVTNNYFHGTVLSEVTNPGDGTTAHVDYLQTWSYHGGYLQNLLFDKNMCSEAHQMMIEGSNSNFTISNNVFANGLMTLSGQLAGGLNIKGTNGVTMIGNTFYNTGGGPYCASSSSNCLIRNCISYVTPSIGTLCAWINYGSLSSEDHNLAYRTGKGTMGANYSVQPYPPAGTDVVDQDPLFVNTSNIVGPDGIPFTADDGLRLRAESPARGAGYGGVDIGAYKYVPGGDTTAPAPPTGLPVY